MIPKKIHYCWFGGKPLPKKLKKYIDSWKKYCPDYEIIEWNEENYDVYKNQFISEAYRSQKYAFVSDYARLDIIYNNGGIYLDTDVELIASLDNLLDFQCFMGNEEEGLVNSGLGFGAVKYSGFLKKIMEEYLVLDKINFENLDELKRVSCVFMTLKVLKQMKWRSNDDFQDLGVVVILPTDYLCPYNFFTGKIKFTGNTKSIHHYDASWQTSFRSHLGKLKRTFLFALNRKINDMKRRK